MPLAGERGMVKVDGLVRYVGALAECKKRLALLSQPSPELRRFQSNMAIVRLFR